MLFRFLIPGLVAAVVVSLSSPGADSKPARQRGLVSRPRLILSRSRPLDSNIP